MQTITGCRVAGEEAPDSSRDSPALVVPEGLSDMEPRRGLVDVAPT